LTDKILDRSISRREVLKKKINKTHIATREMILDEKILNASSLSKLVNDSNA
jgi:hypothetical protein